MAQVSSPPKHFLSDKVEHFTESVIREMTRQAMQYGAVNLAQGFPDFSAPAEIKKAAQDAIAADVNQYAITWGAKNLRNAIARQMQEWRGLGPEPPREKKGRWWDRGTMSGNPAGGVDKRREGVAFAP